MPTTERDLSGHEGASSKRSFSYGRFSTAVLAGIAPHTLMTAGLIGQGPDDPNDYMDGTARDLNLAFSGVVSVAMALAVLVVVGIRVTVRRAGVGAAGVVIGTAAGLLLLVVAAALHS